VPRAILLKKEGEHMVTRIPLNVRLSAFLPLFLLLASCSGNPDPSDSVASVDGDDALGGMSEELAIGVASAELVDKAGVTERDAWTYESTISEAYPIYRPGSDTVAYYDCKVVTGGQDAGSILVNVDESDLIIPEALPSGKTVSEQYAELLGDWDFRVVRYDWLRTAAVGPDGKMRAKRGFLDDATAQQQMAAMERANTERGAFPLYDRSMIKAYYRDMRAAMGEQAPAGDIGVAEQAASDWRTDYAELANSVSGRHTPSWRQIYLNDADRFVGCGPTAWATLYAYWRQFHSAIELFEGIDVSRFWTRSPGTDPEIEEVLRELSADTNTYRKTVDGTNEGWTDIDDMCGASAYGTRRGYASTCRKDMGTEWDKFWLAHAQLGANHPVILHMGATDDDLIPNHFAVIEAAQKGQIKYLWTWHNRYVRYLINFGGGDSSRWVYVRDWGQNDQAVYASHSMYRLDMTVPAPATPHGGSMFQGHEYRISESLHPWQEAFEYCRDRNAYLVNISSSGENEFVRGILAATTFSRAWIGLVTPALVSVAVPGFDFGKASGPFVWVNEQPLVYSNWATGEPNGGGSERAVEIRRSGTWNDLPEDWTAGALCEWD
jgi:hypothetical protein